MSGSSLGSSPSPVNPPRFPLSCRHRTPKTHLSYSLDKGLDKLDLNRPASSIVLKNRSIMHVGSEPTLDAETTARSSEEENHKALSKTGCWQNSEPVTIKLSTNCETNYNRHSDASNENISISLNRDVNNQISTVEKCWNGDEVSVMSAPEQMETLSRQSPIINNDRFFKESSENCDKSVDKLVVVISEEKVSEN